MTYRVYSGPPGTEAVPPMEKERWLYKEFGLLDEALGWAATSTTAAGSLC